MRPSYQSRSREDKGYLIYMDRYTILVKGEVLYENLGQLEYFERMEDLALEYYQTGSPAPHEIETKTIGD